MKAKKREGEGGERFKKAIIGIAMAAIMLAVLAAIVPMSSAQPPRAAERQANGSIVSGNTLFLGEHDLHFHSYYTTGANMVTSLKKFEDSTVVATIPIPDPRSFTISTAEETGDYRMCNATACTPTDNLGDITIKEPSITGNVYLAGTTDSIVGKSIPEGQPIKIRATPNFGGLMNYTGGNQWSTIKIKLIDPDGVMTVQPETIADAPEINIDNIDTTGWDTGEWTVRIVTNKTSCNEVDVKSPDYKFTIRSSELSIDAVKEVVYKGEDIILTVTGYPNYYYYFAIENVTAGEELRIKYTADIVSLGTGEGSPGAATAAWIKTGSDGIADIKIDTCRVAFAERIYTMHVYDTYHVAGAVPNETDEFAAPADVTGAKDEDEEKVKLEPVRVTFDIPKIVVIGDEVMIKGTVSGGNIVDILIEDGDIEYFNDEPVDENKEFEVEWDTVGLKIGSYRIDVYIDCLFDSFEEIEAAGIAPDGSIIIRLISYPYLDANLSKDTVLVGDSFEIYGNASFGYVEIVTISPEGGNGAGMEGLYGVSINTVPTFITADTFSGSKIAIKEKGNEVKINAPSGKIVFDMPTTCIIGENMAVKGTASEGDSVDIAIDDLVKAVDILIENETFYTEISTVGYSPGAYVIDAFIDEKYSAGEDVFGEENDGAIAIRLISPGLTTNLSSDTVQPGGKFVINGTATGTDHVDIITISPKGGGGAGLYEKSYPGVLGITNESIPVENNSFLKTINVSEDADTGRYVLWVSVPGRDVYYGNWYDVNNASELIKRIIDDYCGGDADGLRIKTQEQILAIFKDATISKAGSDDLACVMELTVGHPGYNFYNSFYKKIMVDGNADTGNYTILVLSPGIDGVYGDSYYSYIDSILDLDGAGPELGAIDMSNKTQEEIVSIIKDVTINQAGSDDLIWSGNIIVTQFDIFDTGRSSNPYPSIFGTHNGTIMPFYTINVSKMYTYSCPGTGGHTEYVAFYNATTGEEIANGSWNGYQGAGDYHRIEFDSPFVLQAKVTYNYTIKTGSYPQIIHAESKDVIGGIINCTKFVDANGKEYNNWIPAIRLE